MFEELCFEGLLDLLNGHAGFQPFLPRDVWITGDRSTGRPHDWIDDEWIDMFA